MDQPFSKTGLLAFSILLITCTTPKTSSQQDQADTKPAFNPTPSPAFLSPEQSLKTFHLPKGYRLELVASEPMVEEPVAIAWDGNGRMYVAEMLTYMQDANATGEQEPRSRISLLEDTNNDGKMDKSTVFIDNLLLPRMIQCVGDELLVNETNTISIWSYKDTNGDGKADQKRLVFQNDKYSSRGANMEHQRSGLDWNLDNWMYMTYEPIRLRYAQGTMRADTIVSGSGGQWGLTHDNYGRLFYSRAGGEVPVHGFQINPVYGNLEFPDQYAEEFKPVWPIIATPDVQGGPHRLRPNNTLNHFTAACGQSIFRGDRLPADLVGDYLVCEPVARSIRRAKVHNVNGKRVLENAYHEQEFIASSDMNFRPVNTATGPDGNLYVVDMHRGIIQQGNWTKPGTFLRQRIDSLGLDKNIGRGRIYRLVHEGYKRGPKPNMLREENSQLVRHLDHPNGWWRDNAQKQLVASGDQSVAPTLKAIASGQRASLAKEPSHLARIHALWTLDGLAAIDQELLLRALQDEHPQVRRTAVWISEPFLKKNNAPLIEAVGKLKADSDYDVRVQVLLSLYGSNAERAKVLVKELLEQNAANEMLVATKVALDKNEDVRTFGSRLGRMAAADRTLILNGAATFKSLCASCHGADGKGLAVGGAAMAAPPLIGSKRVAYPEKNTTLRILLHGLTGPLDGKTYTGVMPAMETYGDEWIASVASYLRYEFGGNPPRGASPTIKPEEVKQLRQAHGGRKQAWTLAELENISIEERTAEEATGQGIR
jgi:glucose/arabinose dehydrogenase/mono/diheme cytochrome c family protein